MCFYESILAGIVTTRAKLRRYEYLLSLFCGGCPGGGLFSACPIEEDSLEKEIGSKGEKDSTITTIIGRERTASRVVRVK